MIRRIFTIAEGNEHGLTPGQYLITIDLGSSEVHFAYRPEVWDAWSRPLEQTAAEDDPPAEPGSHTYGGEGRVYDPNLDMARLGVSLATSEAAPPPSITCPKCGRTSYNPGDIEHRYCGACNQYHDVLIDESGGSHGTA